MRNVRRLLVACVVTSTLMSVLVVGQAPNDPVTVPSVSENASPLEPITPVATDGFKGQGFLRKPPGNGPFPAVVLIHPGLTTISTQFLRQYASTGPLPSRFLEAGYVVATITYRSRDVDLQSQVSRDDSLAAVEYVQRLPYVNAASLGIFGCSGGGDLAIAVAAEKKVAAIVAEEPATILFTGVFNNTSPKAGTNYTPFDSAWIFKDVKKAYTEEFQRQTRQKIEKIESPMLIVQGDAPTPLAVNDFNATVLIPEFKAARKSVDVITYPGQTHCFAMMGGPAAAPAALKAFRDSDGFFRKHFKTQPKPIDPALVTQVPLVKK